MFRPINQPDNPVGSIFWFSHAGSGAANLVRIGRTIESQSRIEVAVLPGREHRYREGTSKSLDTVVEELFQELAVRAEGPYVLVGHSFGSLLSYLLASRLIEIGKPPAGLIVMTLAAPRLIGALPKVADMTLEEFADYIDSRFGGIPESIRNNRDALGVFLPIIQYDMSLLESYEHRVRDPLPVPITALGGTRDRAVSQEKLEAWSEFTSKEFGLTMIVGDHFFPSSELQSIIQSAEAMFDQ